MAKTERDVAVVHLQQSHHEEIDGLLAEHEAVQEATLGAAKLVHDALTQAEDEFSAEKARDIEHHRSLAMRQILRAWWRHVNGALANSVLSWRKALLQEAVAKGALLRERMAQLSDAQNSTQQAMAEQMQFLKASLIDSKVRHGRHRMGEVMRHWRLKELGSVVLEWRSRYWWWKAAGTVVDMEQEMKRAASEALHAEKLRRGAHTIGLVMWSWRLKEVRSTVMGWRANRMQELAKQREASYEQNQHAALTEMLRGSASVRMRAVAKRMFTAHLRNAFWNMVRAWNQDTSESSLDLLHKCT